MSTPYRLPALLSFPLAVLLAIVALGGILVPAVYAREHPHWAALGIGQDWANLVFAAPLLALSAFYALYALVLYAFFMHFGPLFLAYAWALGLAFFALVGVVCALRGGDVQAWFRPDAPVKPVGAIAVLLGADYYVLWLSEIVPALTSGAVLKSATDVGLITNPVEVLDLGIVLPAFVLGGVALFRRRPLGYWLAPTMLGFGVVMAVALLAMALSMEARGTGGGPPLVALVAMLLLTGGALVGLLRRLLPAETVEPTVAD